MTVWLNAKCSGDRKQFSLLLHIADISLLLKVV